MGARSDEPTETRPGAARDDDKPAGWQGCLIAVAAVLAMLLGIGLLVATVSLLRGPVVRTLGELSGHSARNLGCLLGVAYVVIGACVFYASRLQQGVARVVLWAAFGLGALLTMVIIPGREGYRPAEWAARSDGNKPAFGAVLSWMGLSALFVFLLVGIPCSFVFTPRRVWRAVLALVVWAGTWTGMTSLVVHANAPGADGDAPQSILKYLGQPQMKGETFFGIHAGAPGIRFTTARHFTDCRAARGLLTHISGTVPHCRDALLLEGTGWTEPEGGVADGGFSCVLFTPQTGESIRGWKAVLGKARVTTPPVGDGHRSDASLGQTYDDGVAVWMVCAEHRGHLPAGGTGSPLIYDVGEMFAAADLGILSYEPDA